MGVQAVRGQLAPWPPPWRISPGLHKFRQIAGSLGEPEADFQVSSDGLLCRNLRRARLQHEAQVRARENRSRCIEFRAEFLNCLIAHGVPPRLQAYRQGARIGVRQQIIFGGVESGLTTRRGSAIPSVR